MPFSSSNYGQAWINRASSLALTTMLVGIAPPIYAQAKGLPSDTAQESDRKDDETAELPAVKVTGKPLAETTEGSGSYTTGQTSAATHLPMPLRETPQSVTVITRQRMDDQQLNSVRDVLENTTGVSSSVTDTERVSFYSRGLEITGLQYDGIPTANIPNIFAPSDSLLDTISYDRVEVVRGATGLLSGWGNPSASINLVRKRPLRDFSMSASLGAGSWDDYRGTLDVSTPLTQDGRVRARVAGAYQDRNSFMDFYKQRRQSAYGVVDFDLTSSTTLSVGYDYQDVKPKGVQWGGLPLQFQDYTPTDWSRSKNFGARWNRWDNTTETAFANLETYLDDGWTLKANYSNRRTDTDAELFTALSYPDRTTGAGLLGTGLGERMKTRQNNVDVMATGPFQLFGRQHELVIGGLWSRNVAHDLSTGAIIMVTPGFNYYTWDGNLTKPDFDDAKRTPTDTTVEQSGLYGAVRFSLADPLKLIVGGRFANYEIDQNTNGQVFHYKKDAKFIPYVGVVYDLNKSYSVYASYTKIFNPQTVRDRNGTPLAPTAGSNAEIGIKGEYLDGRLNASVSLFDVHLDNVAQIDSGHMINGTQAYYAANGTKSRGIDFDLQGEITRNWNVYFGLSHFTASANDGTRLTSEVPRTTARLFTTYRLPGDWNRLTVGGGVNWQSSSYRTITRSYQGLVDVGQASYALVSLMARYDIAKGTTISANVNNLFDKKYYSMIGLFNQAIYGEPRNFMVTLSHKF